MHVNLTIVRYKKWLIPFAFLSMALFRWPLWRNKNIRFFKLMGSGKNGSFDKTPDLQQWAILTVSTLDSHSDAKTGYPAILGKFIIGWLEMLKCEVFFMNVEAIEGHGTWDGKYPFGNLPRQSAYDGKIAVLTRATIRLSKLRDFWQNVPAVSGKMKETNGFIASFGIGEIPWIKQATFSIWESKKAMMDFAYGMREHQNVIQKTHKQNWYSEDMFVRFIIVSHHGTIKGINPLI